MKAPGAHTPTPSKWRQQQQGRCSGYHPLIGDLLYRHTQWRVAADGERAHGGGGGQEWLPAGRQPAADKKKSGKLAAATTLAQTAPPSQPPTARPPT